MVGLTVRALTRTESCHIKYILIAIQIMQNNGYKYFNINLY